MKQIRVKKNNRTVVVGFTNIFVSYGKIRNKYKIEIKTPFNGILIPLWYSKKKPYFRNINVISFFVIPFALPVLIISIIAILIATYIEGARNFITNSRCIDNIQFFGWLNIIAITVLFVLLFLL